MGDRHGQQTWGAEAAAAVDTDKGSGNGNGRQTWAVETVLWSEVDTVVKGRGVGSI